MEQGDNMKFKYIDSFRRLVIDGEDNLIIPGKESKGVINIDSDSLNRMFKKHGIEISLKNFHVTGAKPTIKEKLKKIFRIAML